MDPFPSSGLLFLHGEKLNAAPLRKEAGTQTNIRKRVGPTSVASSGGAHQHRAGIHAEDVYRSSEHEISSYFAYIHPTFLAALFRKLWSQVNIGATN